MAEPVRLLLLVAACAAAVLVVSWLVLAVHELAHAAAALLAGAQVHAIDLGAGAAVQSFWLGGTQTTVRRWPGHGRVEFSLLEPGRFRLRVAAILLAGPVASAAVAGVATWAWWHRSPVEPNLYWDAGVPLDVGVATTWWWAIVALLPLRFRFAGVDQLSDVRQLLQLARLSAAESAAARANQAIERRNHAFFRSFLQGRVDEALALCEPIPADEPAFVAHTRLAIATLAQSGGHAALAIMARANQDFVRWREKLAEELLELLPAQRRPTRRMIDTTAQWMRINEAFFLAQTDRPADLERARQLTTTDPNEDGPDAVTAAMLRTGGLVLLRSGRVESGLRQLRRAWRLEEPCWLRSLCAAFQAEGHALLGQRWRARRWLARARRLGGSNPLLPAVVGRVERILAGTAD